MAEVKRVFKYDDKVFDDPDPQISIQAVKNCLAGIYPELAEATENVKTLADGTQEITFTKVAGRKG